MYYWFSLPVSPNLMPVPGRPELSCSQQTLEPGTPSFWVSPRDTEHQTLRDRVGSLCGDLPLVTTPGFRLVVMFSFLHDDLFSCLHVEVLPWMPSVSLPLPYSPLLAEKSSMASETGEKTASAVSWAMPHPRPLNLQMQACMVKGALQIDSVKDLGTRGDPGWTW